MFAPFDLESIQAALGWTVLHFLWQGAVIGLIFAGVLAAVRKEDAAVRYAAGSCALLVSLITFGATFGLALSDSTSRVAPFVALPASVDLDAPEFAAASSILAELTGSSAERLGGPSGFLAWLWMAGAVFMAARLARGCVHAHRLRTRALTPVDPAWQSALDALCTDLGIRRAVRLLKSELVDSPAVVGWLTPLVLVPATTFTALTPEQLRAVLAHELAHIKRYDHLANALQALIEVLLFFHPVVWWLSRVVREEREHCCDAAAVQATGSPLLLAQALTRLESLRLTNPSVALAAKTHGGPLMNRISHILDTRPMAQQRPIGWRFLSGLSAGVLALGLGVAQAAPEVAADPVARASVSPQSRDAKADYAIIEARILSAVEAGELSAKDAKLTLSALRRTMFPVLQDGVAARYAKLRSQDQYEDALSRYAAAAKKARAAVKAGDISGVDAKRRLAEYKMRLDDDARGADPRFMRRDNDSRRLPKVQGKIKEAVKAEWIYKEVGKKRQDEIREYLSAAERGTGVATDLRWKYRGAQAKFMAAVEAGDLSREEAEKKLDALQRKLGQTMRDLDELRDAFYAAH